MGRVVLLFFVLAVSMSTTARAGNEAVSRPAATRPAGGPERAAERLALPTGAYYWLKLPHGYGYGEEPPLVVCLHGTDEPAAEAIKFWSSCGLHKGAVWVAPQSSGPGWRDTDLRRLADIWIDVQRRVTFDRGRVLLVGFSAGGAMAFHWVYREGFPATAVATLANYLPPSITTAEVAARKNVPVFYAVGMSDINHERMRRGLAMLRGEGVHVTLCRPPIGHVLSAEVGREAIAWFEERARERVSGEIRQAAAGLDRGRISDAAVLADRIMRQRRWHDACNVVAAEKLWAEASRTGREQLAGADALAAAGRNVDAILSLRSVENMYAGTSLADHARQRREAIEADPAVRNEVAARERAERERRAMELYLDAQRRLAAGGLDDARRYCQTVVTTYGDTRAAEYAAAMLRKLPENDIP